jgi:hypothetical protein
MDDFDGSDRPLFDEIDESNRRPYHEWLRSVFEEPFSVGGQAIGLVLSAVGVTALMAILGLRLFPPGRFPNLVLALPGLAAGILYLYLSGLLFIRLKETTALWLGIIVAITAGILAIIALTS